jgi:hypothetical protein
MDPVDFRSVGSPHRRRADDVQRAAQSLAIALSSKNSSHAVAGKRLQNAATQ